MNHTSILGSSKLVAFISSTDLAKARPFYEGVLGLRMAGDNAPVALVFDANGTMLRITAVANHAPAPFTVLGWDVESIEGTVESLEAVGVQMLRYPGVNENLPHGIWKSPGGARVAWFHDPDGNVLSVTQF